MADQDLHTFTSIMDALVRVSVSVIILDLHILVTCC